MCKICRVAASFNKLFKEVNYRFILGAKASDHAFLFDWVKQAPETREVELFDEQGTRHRFRYLNGTPLNEEHFDLDVNFLEYWETKTSGKPMHFSWITDQLIREDNLIQLMRGGRAKWRVENEAFNTLKNHDYNHNERESSSPMLSDIPLPPLKSLH